MKRKTKVSLTKIVLCISLGILWYFVAKAIYLWYREKRNINKQINLGRLIGYALIFDCIVLFLMCS